MVAVGFSFLGCNAIKVNKLRDRIVPSNDRDWSADLARESFATLNQETGKISLTNIRNNKYITEKDFISEYYDREFELSEVQSVDFVVVPFKNEALAHTMMSFGFRDGTYLGVSIEIRTEKDEDYSPLLGTTRQYELIYLFADERDIIRLRTRHRDADVYIYPTVATPEQAQQLLVDVVERANSLAMKPEFYNTLTNNCTTNLAGHVNTVAQNKIKYGWKVLLPGFSAKYAYDLGLLPNDVPFEDLKALAYVNELVEAHFDDPNFSQVIRSRRSQLARMAARQKAREPVLNGSGNEFLNSLPTIIR